MRVKSGSYQLPERIWSFAKISVAISAFILALELATIFIFNNGALEEAMIMIGGITGGWLMATVTVLVISVETTP